MSEPLDERDVTALASPVSGATRWTPKVTEFTCPRCGAVSHHPDDRRYGYCGRCHDFTACAHCGRLGRHTGRAGCVKCGAPMPERVFTVTDDDIDPDERLFD